MGDIVYDEKKFIYQSEAGKQTLLDLRKTLDNKSNIPMIETDEREVTVLKLIDCLQQLHPRIDSEAGSNQLGYVLADFLLCRCLMRTAEPVHVAEIGCTSGILSFHIAFLMGQYNRNSRLCGICDSIGNESSNGWLDRISLVEEPPQLALSVTDYDNTLLQEKSFDLVIINGREPLQKPREIVEEAVRILKDGGDILCYEKGQPQLTEALFMGDDEPEIFSADNDVRLAYLQGRSSSWERFYQEAGEEEYFRLVTETEKLLMEGASKNVLRAYYKKLDNCLTRVMQEKHIDWKIRLVDLEERLLDEMYPG